MDSNTRRVEELMTDCGDQSHYKAFFSFNRNFDESWFYNYVGPHARKEGFEYKNFNNSKDFADYCTLNANQSINCLPLTEMGGPMAASRPCARMPSKRWLCIWYTLHFLASLDTCSWGYYGSSSIMCQLSKRSSSSLLSLFSPGVWLEVSDAGFSWF